MTKDQKRALVIIVVVAIAVVIGIVNWQANQKAEKKEAAQAKAQTIKPDVSIIKSKLPKNWGVQVNETGAVLIQQPFNHCYAAARYSGDVTGKNSPTADHNEDRINEIEAKGYTVEVLPAGTLTMASTADSVDVPSQVLKISQADQPTIYQAFGYISNDKFYANVDISCLDQADLPEAGAALQVLRFNHDLAEVEAT